MLPRVWDGEVLPEDWSVGDVVSGGFQGFVRVPQVSTSEEAASAPDPLGLSVNSSAAAFLSAIVRVVPSRPNLPRERETSLFVLVSPLPIVLLPQMPPEACHDPPLPKVCERAEG